MQLTISLETGNPITVDVASDLTLGDLKAYVGAESDIDPEHQVLIFKGQPLTDNTKTLEQHGIEADDLLMCVNASDLQAQPGSQSQSQSQSQQQASGGNAQAQVEQQLEQLRQQIKANPQVRADIEQRWPSIIPHLDDPAKFNEEMIKIQTEQRDQQRSQQAELIRLQSDPDNEQNQAKILELIQQEQIAENYETAMEHNPEVFASVTMLYVNLEVNGEPVKAFVDTGAQATIMDMKCVERCKLSHLVDKRFHGVARGVGSAKICGRIHQAPMKLGESFLPCSFTIMEKAAGVEMLLGLDMLKRHQGVIDLGRNTLNMGGAEITFLGESEIPKDTFDDIASLQPEQALPTEESSSSSSIPNPPPRPDGPSEQDVEHLMSLGFGREQATHALKAANGNIEVAAGLLFQ